MLINLNLCTHYTRHRRTQSWWSFCFLLMHYSMAPLKIWTNVYLLHMYTSTFNILSSIEDWVKGRCGSITGAIDTGADGADMHTRQVISTTVYFRAGKRLEFGQFSICFHGWCNLYMYDPWKMKDCQLHLLYFIK